MANTTDVTREKSAGSNVRTSPQNASTAPTLRPAVDIFETRDGILVQADMPGVAKEGLNLSVDGQNLLVEGTIGIAPEQSMHAIYADVRATKYRRSFVLGNELDTAGIEAKLDNGVLTVRIPKRAELRPRKIEIRS
jgi:HSP20 family molecular chaperone IbpA